MKLTRKSVLLLLGILPATVLSCTDSTTYTFGTYEYNGSVTTRTCAWITANSLQTATRQSDWCGEIIDGSLVSVECPVACDSCPTAAPTKAPTTDPPTAAPTVSPGPTEAPTRPPSPAPSPFPTSRPSKTPSESPSDVPSLVPSQHPSDVPSLLPSLVPSQNPSLAPSDVPSTVPSQYPSLAPSEVPSDVPTGTPSDSPSLAPSEVPSDAPTSIPTASIKPSPTPSAAPFAPTMGPTAAPTATATTMEPTVACEDSQLRLKIIKDGNTISRFCTWVAEKDTNNRCALGGVSAACPVTCGTCTDCVDPDAESLRFKFPYNGKEIARSCEFVGRIASKVAGRCAASENICRATCDVC